MMLELWDRLWAVLALFLYLLVLGLAFVSVLVLGLGWVLWQLLGLLLGSVL
jgi:hypothetical protein